MSKKLQAIILALGLSVVIFGVGCSDDDDDDNPSGPTTQERLVGFWDATNPEALTGGLGYVEFDFNDNNTFSLVIAAITGPLDDTVAVTYTGTYEALSNGNLHMTDIELDGEPQEETYHWPFGLYADDDSLDCTHTGLSDDEVHYLNVTPPDRKSVV